MNRVQRTLDRYAAAGAVAERGVSIFTVGDPAGAQLNAAVQRTLLVLGKERSEVWADLLGAANALRWRRMTQPQPNAYQSTQADLVEEILRQTKRLRHFVGDESLLDQLAAAATEVSETDSPVGTVLLESILEVGVHACVVIACKGSAKAGLQSWLDDFGVIVAVPSDLGDLPTDIEQSYVVAPPIFMPRSVVTAPVTSEITFVMPAWYGNRTVPGSSLGPYAEGRIEVRATVHQIGDAAEPPGVVPGEAEDDTYFPQPIWGDRSAGDREPASDEVEAWKVLLGGGLAIWLDDGDRIRSLDPRQPEGDRVGYEAVSQVDSGTYLVLREGEAERGAMLDQALRALGPRAVGILATQERWKRLLKQRLARVGPRRASDELFARGVQSAGQVRAWADPRLICPQRESDFTALLAWLGEAVQPTYSNAITLRRAVYKVTAELRKELEVAVARSDLRALESDGVLRLALPRDGFRGMIVARVLARSPFTEIVARNQVRVPFKDGSAKWLD
ncbi:hypothetical protein NQ854_07695 [Rhodococcus ruber]|uniref:hypothetical protein n=1 Tax=Rhodococcus ruber TaxID=1830 RepID=UPI00387DCA5D